MTTTNPVPLSHYLTAHGWTHAKLASAIGRHPPLITAIVGGRRTPRPKTRQALCRALGVANDELLDMLEASRSLALHSDQRQLCKAIAEVTLLAKRCKEPAPVTIAVARAGRRALFRLLHPKKRLTVIIPRRRKSA